MESPFSFKLLTYNQCISFACNGAGSHCGSSIFTNVKDLDTTVQGNQASARSPASHFKSQKIKFMDLFDIYTVITMIPGIL